MLQELLHFMFMIFRVFLPCFCSNTIMMNEWMFFKQCKTLYLLLLCWIFIANDIFIDTLLVKSLESVSFGFKDIHLFINKCFLSITSEMISEGSCDIETGDMMLKNQFFLIGMNNILKDFKIEYYIGRTISQYYYFYCMFGQKIQPWWA